MDCVGIERAVRELRRRIEEWKLRVEEVKTSEHGSLVVEPSIPNGIDVIFVHGLGSTYNPKRDGEVARRLAASGFRVHLLYLPGQGSPPRKVKSYEELAEWAMKYLRSRAGRKVIVVGHSFGGEVAKALVKKLKEEGYKVRGIVIAPAGRREGIGRVVSLLAYPYAIYKALKNGVSLKQVLRYARIINRDYVSPLREVEIIQGYSDRMVPKASRRIVDQKRGRKIEEWMREEYHRGGHFPLSPEELAEKILEAATRLE